MKRSSCSAPLLFPNRMHRRPPLSRPRDRARSSPPHPAPARRVNRSATRNGGQLFQDEASAKADPSGSRAKLRRSGRRHSYSAGQAQVGITRADQFPTISGGAGFRASACPVSDSIDPVEGALLVGYRFLGKYRRATEAARANVLAFEWNRQEVISTLVMNVAMAYFELRELDLNWRSRSGRWTPGNNRCSLPSARQWRGREPPRRRKRTVSRDRGRDHSRRPTPD